MAISVREREIQKLVRFYRRALKDLAQDFVAASDFEKPRIFSQLGQSFSILDELDERTARWADRNIGKLYLGASREAQKSIESLGVSVKDAKRASAFAVVNREAIDSLLVDPEIGFVTSLRESVDQIRSRMKSIQSQAKMMARQQGLFNTTIARVGFLEGRNLNDIRDRLVDEMVSMKNNSDLLFTSKAAKLPPGQIIRNVANLPFVMIPDSRSSTGFRRLRADKYAEMLARTKTAQAANLARRNKALQHDIELIQISKNKPLQDDACFLYVGKVFALTPGAGEEFGVPLVSELPNGGAPFHPNCTHQELQFIREFADPRELKFAMTPPPDWALNKPWAQVQKEYNKRGGLRNITGFKGKKIGVDTGGRARRRDDDELTAVNMSRVEAQIERSVAPALSRVATGSSLGSTVQGVGGAVFQNQLLKKARSLVDRGVKEIENLSSAARERLVSSLPPRLAADATRSVERSLIPGAVGDAARSTMDDMASAAIASGLPVSTKKFADDMLDAGIRSAKNELPSGMMLSAKDVEGVVKNAVKPQAAAAISSAKSASRLASSFRKSVTGELTGVAEESVRRLMRRASSGVESNRGVWLASVTRDVRNAAARRASDVFDDRLVVGSLAAGLAASISEKSLDRVVESVDRVADDVLTASKRHVRRDLRNVVDLDGVHAGRISRRIKRSRLSGDSIDRAISDTQRVINARTSQVMNDVDGYRSLPRFVRDRIAGDVSLSVDPGGMSSEFVDGVVASIRKQQKSAIGVLVPRAKNNAQEAVDRLLSGVSDDDGKRREVKNALKSTAEDAAKSVLISGRDSLAKLGVPAAEVKEIVDRLVDEIVRGALPSDTL